MIDERFYRGFCLALSLSVILSAGCTSVTQPVTHDPLRPQAERADSLMAAGDFAGAAHIYRSLADRTASPDRERHQISVVDALVKSGNDLDARAYAQTIDARHLPPAQRIRLGLLLSQIDLSAGNAEDALARLERIDRAALSETDLLAYHRQRAFAYSLVGKPLESARERIAIQPMLDDAEKRQENGVAILDTLSVLPAKALRERQPPPPSPLAAWMELARILKVTPSGSQALDRAIQAWRHAYPSIPIDPEFLRGFAQRPSAAFREPSHLAVLLPQSGPYAEAGRAIREGFVSAYYAKTDVPEKPSLHFYDTQRQDTSTLYQKVVAEGADFVVGPLEKQNLESLARNPELDVPVLALNQVPGLYKSNLYQLALSPEDEAEQVANAAWSHGHRRALVMVPRSELGQRIANHFVEYWKGLGGDALATKTYDPSQSDFSPQIKQLLNLDESQQRYQRLRSVIPGVDFSPRQRQDADLIFLVGYPREARLIRPQLQFYGSRLPIYSTSHVYGGRQDPAQDTDLDDIVFCDIPWLFHNAAPAQAFDISPAQSTWQQFPDSYLRLIALGIDAYDLIPHLPVLRSTRYSGATGDLLLNDDNRIQRQLPCAQFDNGIPRLLGFSSPDPVTTPTYQEHPVESTDPDAP